MAFFNRTIMGRTQILVHRWGPHVDMDFGTVLPTDLTKL